MFVIKLKKDQERTMDLADQKRPDNKWCPNKKKLPLRSCTFSSTKNTKNWNKFVICGKAYLSLSAYYFLFIVMF